MSRLGEQPSLAGRGGVRWLAILMFAAAFLAAVITLFAGHTIWRNAVARTWPVAEGRVVSSKAYMAVVGRNNQKALRARVDYQYTVDRRTFQATHLHYDRGIGGTFCLYGADYADRYPTGRTLRVAYDPERPEHSVVEMSSDPYARFTLGVGVLIAYAAYLIRLNTGRRPAVAGAGGGTLRGASYE
ncbi:MAG TPA: DUF3592 domain-containing protein [Tepidisphaeraceae bacterium]|jgi:hypothetical protein